MKKIQFVAVSAFIENNGKFLIIRRAFHDSRPGTWETPGGGVEWGEDPQIAIKREVKEECGLDVVVNESMKVLSWISEKSEPKRHLIQIVFRCSLTDLSQEVKLSREHDEFKWVDESGLKDTNMSFFLESLTPKTG